MRILLLLLLIVKTYSQYCVCTTVQCPHVGNNSLTMGEGGSTINYIYEEHNNIPVVVYAHGVVYPESLHNGSDTTSCTRSYARMLEDDGKDNCDAGHILANRLGGYGNQPLNIFPQNPTINQGVFNQFEGKIYDCMLNSSYGILEWQFIYESLKNTQPYKVTYYAYFEESTCEPLYSEFTN